MLKIRYKEQTINICTGLLITCFIVWILSSFSFLNTSCNRNDEGVKTTAMTDNQRPPKPLGDKGKQLNAILRDCGQLCDTSRKGSPGPYFDHVTAPIDCMALFKNDYIDLGHGQSVAPKEMPPELVDGYTMGGRIRTGKLYFNQQFLGQKQSIPVWTVEAVNKMIQLAKKGMLEGTYGRNDTNSLRDGLKNTPRIINGRVLVIGSRNPWVEACVLEAGAREIVTLEYGAINSKHPQLKTMVPLEFRRNFLEDKLEKFDAVVTFSSVEHSGLGRFGDMLNPWGDIITIARAWCVTKDGGYLTIGVPYDFDNEYIRFNGDRGYGKIRYPYLTTNWKQYYIGWGVQRVHVFTKSKYI